jgi:hypothetical protein
VRGIPVRGTKRRSVSIGGIEFERCGSGIGDGIADHTGRRRNVRLVQRLAADRFGTGCGGGRSGVVWFVKALHARETLTGNLD